MEKIKYNQYGQYMTKKDIQFIKDNYMTMTNHEIGKIINKKGCTIKRRLHQLGLKRDWFHKFTKGEDKFIKGNYKSMNNKELGNVIGVSANSIKHYLVKFKLKRDFSFKGKSKNYLKESDIEFIKNNYLSITGSKMGKILEKEEGTITRSLQILGLKRDDTIGVNTESDKTSSVLLSIKKEVTLRDDCSCFICGSKEKLVTHHINYNKRLHLIENLITLCSSCHTKTNFCRTYWIKFFQSMLSDRYGYKYEDNEIVLEVNLC